MQELLSIPAWNTPPRSLDDWLAQFRAQGHSPRLVRAEGETWLVIEALGLRGYVIADGKNLEAIHFELSAPDLEPANHLLQATAAALGWELHDEPDDDDS